MFINRSFNSIIVSNAHHRLYYTGAPRSKPPKETHSPSLLSSANRQIIIAKAKSKTEFCQNQKAKSNHDVAWRRSTTTTATLSCVLNRIARLTNAFASSSAPIPGSFLSSCLMNVAHCCEFTVSQSPSDASTCTQTRHDVSRLIAVKPSNCQLKKTHQPLVVVDLALNLEHIRRRHHGRIFQRRLLRQGFLAQICKQNTTSY